MIKNVVCYFLMVCVILQMSSGDVRAESDGVIIFEDQVFKSALINAGIDTNSDGEITIQEAYSRSGMLMLNDGAISSIEGIQYFTNLSGLYLNNNEISDISQLSNLVNLVVLQIYENNVSDISSILRLNKLTNLELRGNRINDFSVLKNITSLEQLSVSNCNISSIDGIGQLQKLRVLWLNENYITDYTELTYLTSLEWLTLNNSHTAINNIDFLTNMSNMLELSIRNNNIDDTRVLENLTNLKYLYLPNNEIKDISVLNSLGNLLDLDVSGNPLYNSNTPYAVHRQELDFSVGGIEYEVWCLDSAGEVPAVPTNVNVTKSGSSITVKWDAVVGAISYDVSVNGDVKNTTSTSYTYTNVDPAEQYDYAVRAKNANGASAYSAAGSIRIIHFNDENFKQGLIDNGLDANLDNEISSVEAQKVSFLDLKQLGIKDLSGIENFINLRELYLRGNDINDVDCLSSLIMLELLDLTYNNIVDISKLSGLQNLNQLRVGGNEISDISSISELSRMNILIASQNNITDISSLSKLTNLVSLYLGENNIDDISVVSNLEKLKYLDLRKNKILNINSIESLQQLVTLIVSGNYIKDIRSLSELGKLETLWLDSNEISDISALGNLTNIKNLLLNFNRINNVTGLAELEKIETLWLGNNEISDASSLKRLTKLKYLSLDNNYINDIAFVEELTYLERFMVNNYSGYSEKYGTISGHNCVRDISSLSSLNNLNTLNLTNNPVNNSDTPRALHLVQYDFTVAGIGYEVWVIPGEVPEVPTNVNATKIGRRITVTWDEVVGATSYDVSVNGDVKNTIETSYTYTDVDLAEQYDYAVRAKNANGASAYSVVGTIVEASHKYGMSLKALALSHILNDFENKLIEGISIDESIRLNNINMSEQIWPGTTLSDTWGDVYNDVIGNLFIKKVIPYPTKDGIDVRVAWIEDDNNEIYYVIGAQISELPVTEAKHVYSNMTLCNQLFEDVYENYIEFKDLDDHYKNEYLVGEMYGGTFANYISNKTNDTCTTYNAPSITFTQFTFNASGSVFEKFDEYYRRYSFYRYSPRIIDFKGVEDLHYIDIINENSTLGRLNDVSYNGNNIDDTIILKGTDKLSNTITDSDIGRLFFVSDSYYSLNTSLDLYSIVNEVSTYENDFHSSGKKEYKPILKLGTKGDDTIEGKANTIFNGYEYTNYLYGGLGTDTIISNSIDFLIGNKDKDTLKGSKYNNSYMFLVGDGQDTIIDPDGIDTIVIDTGDITLNAISINVLDTEYVLKYGNNDSITWDFDTSIEYMILVDGEEYKKYDLKRIIINQEATELFDTYNIPYFYPEFYSFYNMGIVDENGELPLTTIMSSYLIDGNPLELPQYINYKYKELDSIFMEIAIQTESKFVNDKMKKGIKKIEKAQNKVDGLIDAGVLVYPFVKENYSVLKEHITKRNSYSDFIKDLELITRDKVFSTEAISLIDKMSNNEIEKFVRNLYTIDVLSTDSADYTIYLDDMLFVNNNSDIWSTIESKNYLSDAVSKALKTVKSGVVFGEIVIGILTYEEVNQETIEELTQLLPMMNERAFKKYIDLKIKCDNAFKDNITGMLNNSIIQSAEIVMSRYVADQSNDFIIDSIEKSFYKLGLKAIGKHINLISFLSDGMIEFVNYGTNGSEILNNELKLVSSVNLKMVLENNILKYMNKERINANEYNKMEIILALKYSYLFEKKANEYYIKMLTNQKKALEEDSKAFIQKMILNGMKLDKDSLISKANDLINKAKLEEDKFDIIITECDKILDENYKFNLDVSGIDENVSIEPELDFYFYGDVVTLKACNNEDLEFLYWSGDTEMTTSSELKIMMNKHKKIIANFTETKEDNIPYIPSVNKEDIQSVIEQDSQQVADIQSEDNSRVIIRKDFEVIKDKNVSKVIMSLDDEEIFDAIDLISSQHKQKHENIIQIKADNNEVNNVNISLSGNATGELRDKEIDLSIETNEVIYNIPYEELNINSQLKNVEEGSISISIEIETPDESALFKINEDVDNKGYTMVIIPISFEITASYIDSEGSVGEKAIDSFDHYVERMIRITDNIDPSQITTGVVCNEDGSFSHVPTEIIEVDGVYYAVVSSLTNSIYTVISNEVDFSDMEDHWAKDDVNEIGSRIVVNGYGDGTFKPNENVTRAELITMIINALGLSRPYSGFAEMPFNDVDIDKWYYSTLCIAKERNIIDGYNNGSFRPNNEILREEAFVILVNAIKVSHANANIEVVNELSGFKDITEVAIWSYGSVAYLVQEGIVQGHNSLLKPKDNISRAEVAVIIDRMLKSLGLINK